MPFDGNAGEWERKRNQKRTVFYDWFLVGYLTVVAYGIAWWTATWFSRN